MRKSSFGAPVRFVLSSAVKTETFQNLPSLQQRNTVIIVHMKNSIQFSYRPSGCELGVRLFSFDIFFKPPNLFSARII